MTTKSNERHGTVKWLRPWRDGHGRVVIDQVTTGPKEYEVQLIPTQTGAAVELTFDHAGTTRSHRVHLFPTHRCTCPDARRNGPECKHVRGLRAAFAHLAKTEARQ